MKNWIQDLLKGGAGYIIMALMSGGMIWGFADHFYDQGVSDCKAEQSKKDVKVDGKIGDLEVKIKDIDSKYQEAGNTIIKEYHTGLSKSDIDNAYNKGVLEGRKLKREEDAKNGFEDEENYCLNDIYPNDSQLLDSGRSLQREVFGKSGGSK